MLLTLLLCLSHGKACLDSKMILSRPVKHHMQKREYIETDHFTVHKLFFLSI